MQPGAADVSCSNAINSFHCQSFAPGCFLSCYDRIKRRTNVIGIFPNDQAIIRLVGAMMLEQNDEWSLQSRYMQLKGLQSMSGNQSARLSAVIN